MKRALAALLSLWTALAILSGCASQGEEPKTMVYYTYFDTVSYIYSYAPDSQTEFEANCALVFGHSGRISPAVRHLPRI